MNVNQQKEKVDKKKFGKKTKFLFNKNVQQHVVIYCNKLNDTD